MEISDTQSLIFSLLLISVVDAVLTGESVTVQGIGTTYIELTLLARNLGFTLKARGLDYQLIDRDLGFTVKKHPN